MCCILRIIITVSVRAYTAPVAATMATGNLWIRSLPFDQSQSISHAISLNTLSHFCKSHFADYHYPYLHTKWHLDECSRMATIEMGRKLWTGLCPFSGEGRAGSPSKTKSPGLRPNSIPSVTLIHAAIWPQQIWAKNWVGAVPLWGEGAGYPSNTMWPGLRPRVMVICEMRNVKMRKGILRNDVRNALWLVDRETCISQITRRCCGSSNRCRRLARL